MITLFDAITTINAGLRAAGIGASVILANLSNRALGQSERLILMRDRVMLWSIQLQWQGRDWAFVFPKQRGEYEAQMRAIVTALPKIAATRTGRFEAQWHVGGSDPYVVGRWGTLEQAAAALKQPELRQQANVLVAPDGRRWTDFSKL